MGIFHSFLWLIRLSVKYRLTDNSFMRSRLTHQNQEEILLFYRGIMHHVDWFIVFASKIRLHTETNWNHPKGSYMSQLRCGMWGWTAVHVCLSTVADGLNRPLCRDAVMNDLRSLDLLKYPFCLMIALWRRWRFLVSHKVVFVKETNCLPAINRTPSYSPSTDLVRWPIRDNKPYSIKFHF